MEVPTTYSYTGRQVDMEFLKSVVDPGIVFQRVYTTLTPTKDVGGSDVKMVTGVEKAIQRYTNLLLTNIDSVMFREDLGGNLVIRVFNGTISSTTQLTHVFAVANNNALRAMDTDDNDERFGSQPDDEKILHTELIDSNVDYATATISLNISITFVSGLNYKYVIPVKAGLS